MKRGKPTHHRSMKSYEPGLLVYGHQEGGDIAVAYDYLRVFPDQIIVNLVKEPQGSISSAGTKNGFCLPVLKHAMEV